MPTIGRRPGDLASQVSSGDIAMIVFALLLVLVFFGMIVSIGVGQSRAHMAFMSNCIEKNSEDRCHLLWRYGREDLAK